jgi:hypothetical protein
MITSSSPAPSKSAGVPQGGVNDLTPHSGNGPISGVKVAWTAHGISGLEFFFGGKSSGLLQGKHDHNVWEETFNVQQGDHIVEVFGRAGDEVNCVGFRTAKGYTKVWGNPLSGNGFFFHHPGHFILALKVGVSQHVSYLEPIYEDEAFLYAKKLNFSQHGKFTEKVGKDHSDSEGFNDFDWIKDKFNYSVNEVKIWTDNNFATGIQFHYNMDGTKKTPGKHNADNSPYVKNLVFNENEHITKVIIRAGDIIDGMTIYTDQGRQLSAGGNGGQAFIAVAPPGHHFIACNGAIGNHLHNIQFHYDEIY